MGTLPLQEQDSFIRYNAGGKAQIAETKGLEWFYHPTDDSVDVAVSPGSLSSEADRLFIPNAMFLTDEIIKEQGIGVGDSVFIIGLFSKFTGLEKNIPIIRVGNVAMMPDEKVLTATGEADVYLIEARSLGGISGSPVFVQRTISNALSGLVRSSGKSERFAVAFGELYFFGLVQGHWNVELSELQETARIDDNEAIEKMNTGIAIVIPAKKILEVINHPELVKRRAAGDEEHLKNNLPTQD